MRQIPTREGLLNAQRRLSGLERRLGGCAVKSFREIQTP